MSIEFNYAARSDVGYVRAGKDNQDGGYAGPHLLVVADGMGGAAGGEIASSVAIAHLMHLDQVQTAGSLDLSLRSALEGAHRELQEISTANPELQGLGTTCIAILRSGNKLAMAHIGDSRAYVLSDGRLTQVTRDHSFVQMLVDTGRITQDEAEHHPKRNVIMRTLGDSQEDIEIDISVRTANAGDRWLLCSDGLSGVVSRETIEETISNFSDPADAAEEIIELTLRAGAPDNVTVVVCDILESTELDQLIPDTTPQVVGSVSLEKETRTPTSPAAKAAALGKKPSPTISTLEPEEDPDDEQNHRWFLRTVVVLAILAGTIIGSWAGYSWTQSQYFIGVSNNNVAIFQGVPWDLGPLKLSTVKEVTGPELPDLSAAQRNAVVAGIPRASLEDARRYVAERILLPNTVHQTTIDPNSPATTEPITIPPLVKENNPPAPNPATTPTPATNSTSSQSFSIPWPEGTYKNTHNNTNSLNLFALPNSFSATNVCSLIPLSLYGTLG